MDGNTISATCRHTDHGSVDAIASSSTAVVRRHNQMWKFICTLFYQETQRAKR